MSRYHALAAELRVDETEPLIAYRPVLKVVKSSRRILTRTAPGHPLTRLISNEDDPLPLPFGVVAAFGEYQARRLMLLNRAEPAAFLRDLQDEVATLADPVYVAIGRAVTARARVDRGPRVMVGYTFGRDDQCRLKGEAQKLLAPYDPEATDAGPDSPVVTLHQASDPGIAAEDVRRNMAVRWPRPIVVKLGAMQLETVTNFFPSASA